MSRPLAARLKALPCLVLVAACVDTLCTRADYDHRPASVELFLQTVALYAVIGLAALVPAALAGRAAQRLARARTPREEAWTEALALFAWMCVPVLAHARLDRYTEIYGGVGELFSWRPWLEVALVVTGALLAVRFLPRALGGVKLAPVAALAAVAAIAAGCALDFHRESSGPAASGGGDGRPNLLLLVWDTTRAKSLNLYGYDRDTTPNLARLAAQSIVFDDARSASRYTLTSHLSMLTGTYPSHHGARLLNQTINPQRTPSIARFLREAGYRTGGFVGTGVLRAQTGAAYAFETWDDQVDPPVCDTYAWSLVHDLQAVAARLAPVIAPNGNPHWIQDFQRPAAEVLARATAWIHDGDPRPWFCFVNLYDVHWPYVPEADALSRWAGPYGGPIDGFLFRSSRYPAGYALQEPDQAHLRDLYDAEMWQLDREVDGFLAGLDLAHGDTAVVMVSDHGEAFGEGGRYEHNDILECQVRIPLLVRPPGGAKEPRRVGEPVSGIDAAATLLAFAGIAAPKEMRSQDLLAPEHPAERRILVEDRDSGDATKISLALYRDAWKLVQSGLGKAEHDALFDLRSDPEGLTDVAAQHPEVVAELAAELVALRATWKADDDPAKAHGSAANRAALQQLGYLGDD